ncbi:MAG: hypothetical protein LBG88_04365 [Christensenellaceae bacterium]|jgi:hypothetical protein|nr:hypothetical protein [Christensenellaceae bacterium]
MNDTRKKVQKAINEFANGIKTFKYNDANKSNCDIEFNMGFVAKAENAHFGYKLEEDEYNLSYRFNKQSKCKGKNDLYAYREIEYSPIREHLTLSHGGTSKDGKLTDTSGFLNFGRYIRTSEKENKYLLRQLKSSLKDITKHIDTSSV